jgi:hypothetical protein
MGAGVGIITAALPRKRVALTDNGLHVSDSDHAATFSHHYHHPHEGKISSIGHGSLSTNSPYASYPSYGSFGSTDGNSRIHSSPERLRRDSQTLLNRVPEDVTMDFETDEGPRYTGGAPLDVEEQDMEEELELDAQLAAQGLYRGAFLSPILRVGLNAIQARIHE